MNAFLRILVAASFVFVMIGCQKREDKTIEKNVLTFLIGCTGGSLAACQSSCATTYPTVTGENYPNVSTCNTNCSTYCSV